LRATILSVESLMGRLVATILLPILGWIVDVYSLTDALFMIGVIVLIFGIFILGMFKKNKII
jgi:F0F1-type ATP synthase assembly protein I